MFDIFKRPGKHAHAEPDVPPGKSGSDSSRCCRPAETQVNGDKPKTSPRPVNGQTRTSAGASADKLHALARQFAGHLQPVVEEQVQNLIDQQQRLGIEHEAILKERMDLALRQISDGTAAEIGHVTERMQELVDGHLTPLADRLEKTFEKSAAAHWSAFTAQMHDLVSSAARSALLRPLIDALLSLLDRVGDERAFLSGWYRRDPELALHLGARQMFERYDGAMQSFCTEIHMILRTLDVHPLQGCAGRFNPHTQRIVAVEATKNPGLDGHVARIIRAGFIWGDMVLRPEQVVVFKKEV